MKKILTAWLALACLFTACDSFVDVIPKGNTIPSTVDDLGKMMNNGSLAINGDLYEFSSVSYSLKMMACYSDDYTGSDNPNSALYSTFNTQPVFNNLLTWADYIYSAAESDYNWDGLYKSNYIVNYVLDNIDEAEEGISYRRDEVKGRALVHRAMNYFLLVNLYGKQWDEATAESDLAVPLVVHADVNAQFPRATVAEVYNQIHSDLDEALELLTTDVPDYNHIPGRATAYALRARVNLWQQNYDVAYADACSALELRSEVTDYNNLIMMMPGIPAYGLIGYDTSIETNPEIMYSRYLSESTMCPASESFLSIVDLDNDLRFVLFVAPLEISGIPESVCWTRKNHSGINTSEVWLTKAEAALRKSSPNVNEALTALNHVRERRYAAATYQPYSTTDPSALLTEIINERRRELSFCAMPFLDQKRLNADPATARSMVRTWKGETYTLPVGDPRWALPIPLNVMALNGQLIQNER